MQGLAKGAVEATDGQPVTPGTVYIAPGGLHMQLTPGGWGGGTGCRIALRDGPPVNNCKPAVDVLIESLAELGGRHVLSVVLTGMGQDGRNGVAAVKRGGYCIAQAEASCVLQDPFEPLGRFDVVFCRNVAIYFSNEFKQELFRKIHQVLHPDGLFFLGASESLAFMQHSFVAQACQRGMFYQPVPR